MKSPDELTTFDIFFEEQNVTIRREMIEKIGFERLLKMAGKAARKVHASGRGVLYQIFLPNDPDYWMNILVVQCPTTKKKYYLRIPPDILNADEAVAWTFSMQPEAYNPIKET